MKHCVLRGGAALLLCLAATYATSQDEGAALSRLKALKAERLTAAASTTAVTTPVKTVFVYCGKGDSISAALAKSTGPLVVEVRGICTENVRIERSDLTLRGLDPASDGLRGVTTDPLPLATVEINHARRVRLENLSVSDGPNLGVGAWWSEVYIGNCRIERNGGHGVHISASSGLTGVQLTSAANSRYGINCQRGGYVTCTGCRLEDNTQGAAQSLWGGVMTLWNTVVSGGGLRAQGYGSYVDVDCVNVQSSDPCSVNIDASKTAAAAYGGGEAAFWGVGPFSGRLFAAAGGHVGVYGSQQTASNRENFFTDSARLTTDAAVYSDGGPAPPATQLQRTRLEAFARATLSGFTVLLDTLTCEGGADAWSRPWETPYSPTQVPGCQSMHTTP